MSSKRNKKTFENMATKNPKDQEQTEMKSHDEKTQLKQDEGASNTSCGKVNKDLLVPKFTFFFFYMAMGAFLPYLGVYYKQLWLNAKESGILLGIRPFIKMLVSPIWGMLTDYLHKPKLILLFSLLGTMVAHWSQSIVSPFVLPCYELKNKSSVVPVITRSIKRPLRNDPNSLIDKGLLEEPIFFSFYNNNQQTEKKNEGKGLSPSEWEDTENRAHKRKKVHFVKKIMIKNTKIKSPKPDHDFRIRDNKKIYITLLVLIIFGEMVAAPAPMLTDSGTLSLLSGREHEYGKQRLFGSFGWGFGSLLSGAIVTAFHSCPYSDNINYVPVFYVFAVAVFLAFLVTSFFKFTSSHESHESRAQNCIQGLMLFKNVKTAAFIFVLFFLGFLHSLKLSFLFWFLQDIGGTPILFTLIQLVSSLSEVILFFVATYVVRKLGHDAVLYTGLWIYAVKYLLYSYIEHPWYVLPIESLQGVTYGLVWTASVSYITSSPGSGATIQGMIHGVYWGLGFAVGGVVGGFLVHVIGARSTFRLMAALSMGILVMFFTLNNLYDRTHSGYMEVSTVDKKEKKNNEKE